MTATWRCPKCKGTDLLLEGDRAVLSVRYEEADETNEYWPETRHLDFTPSDDATCTGVCKDCGHRGPNPTFLTTRQEGS